MSQLEAILPAVKEVMLQQEVALDLGLLSKPIRRIQKYKAIMNITHRTTKVQQNAYFVDLVT